VKRGLGASSRVLRRDDRKTQNPRQPPRHGGPQKKKKTKKKQNRSFGAIERKLELKEEKVQYTEQGSHEGERGVVTETPRTTQADRGPDDREREPQGEKRENSDRRSLPFRITRVATTQGKRTQLIKFQDTLLI